MRRGSIRAALMGLCGLLGAHLAAAQTISGAPPITAPVLPTDQIFIFRGQTPVNSVQIGNLITGFNDCHATLAKGLVPTPPNSTTLFLNGQCQWTAVSAVVSQINVGTTIVAAGSSGYLLYNNAGILGNETLDSLLTSPPVIGSITPNAGTFSVLTATSNFTATGLVTLGDLATQGANTVLGNATAGLASPTALTMTDCHAAGDALIWTANTGFGCGTGFSSAVGANPTATAGAAAINGSSTNFMRADAAPAVAKGTNSIFGIVEGDGTTITINSGVVTCMTATVAQIGCAKPDGTTITISGGVLTSTAPASSSISVGVTTIGSGAPGDLLYDNGGVLGNKTFAAACTNATSAAFGCVKVDGTTITASSGVISAIPSPSLASGFVNKIRNSGLTDWFSGTSNISVGTSLTWTAEGMGCLETGATVTASQVTNPLAGGISYYGLKLLGNIGNTDVTCRFVVASYDAASLSAKTVTFQIPIQNKTGATITPTITTKYSNTQDTWASPVTDLATTNLQSCSNNTTCILSYTFAASASAYLGYEIVIDFGAIGNTDYLVIGGGTDLRATPNVSIGLNSSPPVPETQPPAENAIWDMSFYETSYQNGTAPGTATHLGMVGGTLWDAGVTSAWAPVTFKVPKRIVPIMSYYDGGGSANEYSYLPAGTTTFADGAVQTTPPFNVSANGFICGGTSTAGVNGSFYTHFTADSRIPGG